MNNEIKNTNIGGRGATGSNGSKHDLSQPFCTMSELKAHFQRQGISLTSETVAKAVTLAGKDKNFKHNE